jgi:hypothetical protein
MIMLYNSDSFAVVQIDVPGASGAEEDAARGGYEIVDKFARKEIFLEGAVAQQFRDGVEALVRKGPNEDELDEFIGGYTVLAQQPLLLH